MKGTKEEKKANRKAKMKNFGNWAKSLIPTVLDVVSLAIPVVAPITAPFAKVSRKLIGVAPKAVNPIMDTKYDNITPKGEHNKTKMVFIIASSLAMWGRIIFPEYVNNESLALITGYILDIYNGLASN